MIEKLERNLLTLAAAADLEDMPCENTEERALLLAIVALNTLDMEDDGTYCCAYIHNIAPHSVIRYRDRLRTDRDAATANITI